MSDAVAVHKNAEMGNGVIIYPVELAASVTNKSIHLIIFLIIITKIPR